MGAGQSKQIVSGTSTTPINARDVKQHVQKVQQTITPIKATSQIPVNPVKTSLEKITNAQKVEEATEKLLTAESLIMTATVAAIAENIIKATLAAGGLVAVANPIVAPALLGVAVVAAAYLRFKAGHMELISNLTLKSSDYIKLMNLVCVAEKIYQLMVDTETDVTKKADLEKFDMNTAAIKKYAELFRIQILLSAPNSLIETLEKAQAITETNFEALNRRSLLSEKSVGKKVSSWFGRKSTFGSLYGDATRVFKSKQMILSINRALDDLFLQIQTMLNRFVIFTQIYSKQFDNIAEKFKLTKEFRLLLTGEDKTMSETPEEAAKNLEAAVAEAKESGVKQENITQTPPGVETNIKSDLIKKKKEEDLAATQIAVTTGTSSNALQARANAEQANQDKTKANVERVIRSVEQSTIPVTGNNSTVPSPATNPVASNQPTVPLTATIPVPGNNSTVPLTQTNPVTSNNSKKGGSRKKKKRCRSKTVRRKKRRNYF